MGKNGGSQNEVNKTGLYWPGKRTEVEKVILPFQTVETVNESKADREKLELFRQRGEDVPGWRNRLVWGDNKYVMASLLAEFAGKINLIYIDPPFATGADFSINVRVGDVEWTKESSVIEEKAYRDTWGRGLDSYLQMMYERLVLMRELLADNGSLYVHLDAHVGHYVKIVLDEVFGKDSFQREIIWRMGWVSGYKTQAKNWIRNHDTILYYVKNKADFTFNKMWIPYPPDYERWGGRPKGKGLAIEDIWGVHVGEGVNSLAVVSYAKENLGFPTQKPEAVLERIIRASSNEGDLIGDFFAGSGTTGVTAEKLGRRWIMSDLSKFAIHTSRKRLLDIEGCRPFEVVNLGRYQKAKLRENGVSRYVEFVLKLYRAEAVSGYAMLHGRKAGRMVHIGGVDSIVTEQEIREAVKECASAGVKAVDILGWDFEMGLHDLVDRIGGEHSVKVRLVQIPKEALEVKDAAKEEIRFFDLNFLEIEQGLKEKRLSIKLKDFVISNPEYLPDEVREKIERFTDYIDYWAVDFNYREDTFHNMWQSFRTRRQRSLETNCSHRYEQQGRYQVLVKVVDIFGNDTNKLVEVEVT